MKTILAFLLFTCASAFARIPDSKIHFANEKRLVVITIDDGYHFNKKAPASIQSKDGQINLSPTTMTEKKIVLNADKFGQDEFDIEFYVCDDANTVCEAHGGSFSFAGNELRPAGILKGLPVAEARPAKAVSAKEKSGGVIVNAHGFIEDDLEGALKKAKAQRKKVLVDFRAPWCPACIRLETEVFDQKIFQTATRELIKVSLNVDVLANKPLAEKYGAKAIPTLVLMDADGNELYRSLDYKPASLLAAEIRSAIKNEKLTYAELKKKAEGGDNKAALILGRREFKAMNFAEAFRWLSKTSDEGLMRANAEISMLSEKADQDDKFSADYLNALKRNFQLFADSFDAIQWRNDWAKKVGDKKLASAEEVKEVLVTNVEKIDRLLEDQKKRARAFQENWISDYSGFEKSELLSQKIESMKQLAPGSEAPSARELANELASIKLSERQPGQVLLAQGYLETVGDKAQIASWLEKLTKAYPDNDVYHRRLARFYLSEKEFAKALPPAQKAVELGADLPLQNLELLAKVQKGLAQKSEAQKTIDRALALPEAKQGANQKAVKSLEDLKKTL